MAVRRLLAFALALACGACGQTWRFAESPGVSPRYLALSCSRSGSDSESAHNFMLAEDYERGRGSDPWTVHGYDAQQGDRCELTLVTQESSCRYAVTPSCQEGGDCVVPIRSCQ